MFEPKWCDSCIHWKRQGRNIGNAYDSGFCRWWSDMLPPFLTRLLMAHSAPIPRCEGESCPCHEQAAQAGKDGGE